jgi:hypothetical protein
LKQKSEIENWTRKSEIGNWKREIGNSDRREAAAGVLAQFEGEEEG